MKRSILSFYIFIFTFLLPSSLMAAPRYARVLFGATELSLSDKPVVDGNKVYAPVDVLKALRVDYAASDHQVAIASDGQAIELKITKHNKVPMIDLEAAVNAVNADYVWDEDTYTATIRSKLVAVELDGLLLTAKVTIPITATSARIWAPSDGAGWKVSVDLPGAKLATDTKSYKVSGSEVSQIRLGQFTDDTARIVIDLNRKVSYKVLTKGPSREIKLSLGAPSQAKGSSASKVTPMPDKVKPVNVTDIQVEPDGDSKISIRINTSGKPTAKAFLVGNPHRLVVDIQRGVLVTPNENIAVEHPLLRSLRTGQQTDLARIVCDIPRMVIYSTTIDSSGITLNLGVPDNSGGKLSDKLIVIDAGHGGPAKGACSSGIMEKDLNLKLAEQMKAALESAGARVIMTREDDCDISLADRPKVADDHCADFFISIHCNSNTVPDSTTGIETYYHFDQLSSKTLATAIHDRVIRQTGMKDLRVRSDGTLYDSGLKVLRLANVPAILIECGYINCGKDRSLLCDESYREKIAQGVVEGLRDYVEGKQDQEGNQ